MNAAELDRLEREVDAVLRKINALAAKRPPQRSAELGDGTPSDPYEDIPDASELDQDDEEPDDDEDDTVAKASATYYQTENDDANRPGDLASSSHPPNRHKFESLTDKVKNEQGIPKSEAMAYVRQNFPDVFASYQEHTGSTSPSSYSKAAPTTFQDAVELEMRKGLSREVAGQRIAQLYGTTLPHRMTKADLAADSFHAAAEGVWQGEAGLSRTESLRKCRLQNPALFRRLQRRA